MILDSALPFIEAIAALRQRSLLPTTLSDAEMAALDRQVRELSFWSAKVTDAGFIGRAMDLIDRVLNPSDPSATPGSGINAARFREEMRAYLQSIGYSPEPGTEGTIQDLATDARQEIILTTNTQLAQGFGQAVQRNQPAARDAFPCDELVRIGNFSAVARGTARDWPARWRAAGGRFYGGGRMIARRDADVWVQLSRFNNPYPPFDYNSGMWTRPVARAEAEGLGVITRGEAVEPMDVSLTAGLTASVKDLPALLQQTLQAVLPGARLQDGVLTREPA